MRPQDISDKTVIIAPLDWGMGHVTRCIPIIRQLLDQHCKVVFAGIDIQIKLIKKDFPEVICEKIPGYNVTLDAQVSTYRQILSQFKGMKKMARQEQNLANQLTDKYTVDVIISDNRFGFFSDAAYNIFMTHQLNPQIPIFRKRVRRLIATFTSFFDCVWIPDDENDPLCGDLSKSKLRVPILYIGWLSRFKPVQLPIKRDILVIVSGPEPERTRFQDDIYAMLKGLDWSYKFVTPNDVKNEKFVQNPSTRELEELINSSEIVISRGGYTTIMELLSLNKTTVLIPTKGQYEQVYLSEIIDRPYFKFMNEDELYRFLVKLNTAKKFS